MTTAPAERLTDLRLGAPYIGRLRAPLRLDGGLGPRRRPRAAQRADHLLPPLHHARLPRPWLGREGRQALDTDDFPGHLGRGLAGAMLRLFAYACEAYARIVGRARNLAGRAALAREYCRDGRVSDVRVDPAEVADILHEAGSRRNRWKVILARCAPPKRPPARAGRTEAAGA